MSANFRLHSILLFLASAATLTLTDCTCTVSDVFTPAEPITCELDAEQATRSFQVQEFSELLIAESWGTNCAITIEQGIKNSLSIQGPKNAVESVRLSYHGEQLTIQLDPCLSLEQPAFTVTLSVTDLRKINCLAEGVYLKGIGLVGQGSSPVLLISASQGATFELDATYSEINLTGSNRGKFVLSGSASTLMATLHKSSSLQAFDLVTAHAMIHNYSVKDADVKATESLHADIRDAGNIRYKGQPNITTEFAPDATGQVIDAN